MDEYVMHEETDAGVTLKVIADSDVVDPRKDFDNACVMCCDHRRYNLGDEDGHDKAREAIRASRDYREGWEEELDFSHGPDLFKAIMRCGDIVTLPLYLYDHSGITMATTPFSCPWDSGQVGFAFMTKATILHEYGGKTLSPAKRERAESLIRGEVQTYDMYLTGDVWGYVVEDESGAHIDSLWGMYGSDYAIEEGREVLKAAVARKKQDADWFEAMDL